MSVTKPAGFVTLIWLKEFSIKILLKLQSTEEFFSILTDTHLQSKLLLTLLVTPLMILKVSKCQRDRGIPTQMVSEGDEAHQLSWAISRWKRTARCARIKLLDSNRQKQQACAIRKPTLSTGNMSKFIGIIDTKYLQLASPNRALQQK